ncbi:tissue alpha-L-fucosidase [Ostrinia furnacalis]|uniref:tissue alpha-L-fucosidase n=1 Tax=Ostrinia furnacalis TaxID=93504 RepID=UPI00103B4098|nr:tissue alpha-L-fucosidase [Ostrinia furnacalis]
MRLLLLVVTVGLVKCHISVQNGNENFLIEREPEAQPEEKGKKYKPDWEDLDTRPLPRWYDEAKIGIFLHWGVFSVPSFYSEWFWNDWKNGNVKEITEFMEKNYPPNFSYQEFAPMLKAEFFEPEKFAKLFRRAGAKYVVLTTKHHEGYTLFPSKRSFNWNSVDVGPHRDLVKDVSDAVRKAGLKFGVYHSLYEWYNPIYLKDKAASFKTRDYPDTKLWPDIKQLINDYKPSVLWADGDWEANDTYWKSTDLLSWLYNDSPVKDDIVVNDRWGVGIPCHHGDFYNCEDRYNPGRLVNHKWENAMTLDKKSWGYRRNMELDDVKTIHELLQDVISTVSCGGNVLINVGPTKEGTIAPIFEERLEELGDWIEVNGEAIYGTKPWTAQNDSYSPDVWYTCTGKHDSSDVTAVYAIFLQWPDTNTLYLSNITEVVAKPHWHIELLGNEGIYLASEKTPDGNVAIYLPELETVKSRNAWTLKFSCSTCGPQYDQDFMHKTTRDKSSNIIEI